MHHVNEIKVSVLSKIEELNALFMMETDSLVHLARFFNWNQEKMQNAWFSADDQQAKQEKLELELGIKYNAKLDEDAYVNCSLPENNTSGTCTNCYEALSEENKYALQCNHTFCEECVLNYLILLVNTGTQGLEAKCM